MRARQPQLYRLKRRITYVHSQSVTHISMALWTSSVGFDHKPPMNYRCAFTVGTLSRSSRTLFRPLPILHDDHWEKRCSREFPPLGHSGYPSAGRLSRRRRRVNVGVGVVFAQKPTGAQQGARQRELATRRSRCPSSWRMGFVVWCNHISHTGDRGRRRRMYQNVVDNRCVMDNVFNWLNCIIGCIDRCPRARAHARTHTHAHTHIQTCLFLHAYLHTHTYMHYYIPRFA